MTSSPQKPKRRRWRWLVVGIVVLAPVAVLYIRYPAEKPFDRTAWAKAPVRSMDDSTRLEMADWIIKRRMLEGKTEKEVIELLGEPHPDIRFTGWDMVFLLGPERSFIRIDSEWLVVRLDDGGRVIAAELTRD